VEFDLAIVGGTVVDGTGAARYRADLGIANGRIAAIRRGTGAALQGAKTVDATGKVVAPGFIDSNSHADWALPRSERAQLLAPLLLQGITTVVGGGCGYSPAPVAPGGAASLDRLSGFLHETAFAYRWSSMGEMLAVLEADRPLINAAFLVGHNTMRNAVLGMRRSRPADRELRTMQEMTRRALRDGAVGLAANLGFRPGAYARDEELLALAGVVAHEGGTCAVHARAYTWMSNAYPPFGAPHNLRAVRDLIEIARRSQARLQVSHVLFAGRRTWRTAQRVLAELDGASAGGADVGFDAVPFTVGNGPIELIFPPWFVARFPQSVHRAPARLRLIVETAVQRALLGLGPSDVRLLSGGDPSLADLEGRDFATIGRQLGMGAVDAQLHVARVAGLGGAAVLVGTFSGDGDDEAPLADVLRHPRCAFNHERRHPRSRRSESRRVGSLPPGARPLQPRPRAVLARGGRPAHDQLPGRSHAADGHRPDRRAVRGGSRRARPRDRGCAAGRAGRDRHGDRLR